MKIIHFSTLHSPQSTRIFHKFVSCTNQKSSHQAIYYCGGSFNLDFPEKVIKISTSFGSKILTRIKNLVVGTFRIIYEKPEYVQLHDPELLIASPFFKIFSIKVIYDSHENFPLQFTSHHPKYLPIKLFLEIVENFFILLFVNKVIASTDEIFLRFKKLKKSTYLIENSPRERPKIVSEKKIHDFIYAGLISPNRGILDLMYSLENTNIRLIICGPFSSSEYEEKCKKTSFWKNNVTYLGVIAQKKVKKLISKSRYGIVSLANTTNYIDSRPTKLFEYLANGSNVIVSSMPYMKEAVDKFNLGYVFNFGEKKSIKENFLNAYADKDFYNIGEINSFFDSIKFFDDQLLSFLEEL